jgi:hypothetical protein
MNAFAALAEPLRVRPGDALDDLTCFPTGSFQSIPPNNSGGAQQCAAHGLHRPTHERPDADSPSADPTQRRCSDWGKDRAKVTGKSARAVGLHPSWALGLHQHRSDMQVEKGDCTGHPAESMETPV